MGVPWGSKKFELAEQTYVVVLYIKWLAEKQYVTVNSQEVLKTG